VLRVLVRGVGGIGSAIAHRLFREGYAVVIHDDPKPTTTRRGMAFADAVFDGHTLLEGVRACRADHLERLEQVLAEQDAIPVYVRPWGPLLVKLRHQVLVDARMRKHSKPEPQREYADFTIGLGPGLVAGRHADVVIETSWDGLGTVLTKGATKPLAGEPRTLGGHARDRYVYAVADGLFCTKARVGHVVRRGETVAAVESAGGVLTEVPAPLDGVLRGLTHDGVPVTVGTKVMEVDPRGALAEVRGIGERPRRIAEAVLAAIQQWRRAQSPDDADRR
jgi:xanthine dehydrogenase accessory factor